MTGRDRSQDRSPPIERIAAVTERLAVLLAAGVPPSAAWGYLADGAAGATVAGTHRAGSTAHSIHSAGSSEAKPRRRPRHTNSAPAPTAGRERDPAHVRVVLTAAAAAAESGDDVARAIATAAREHAGPRFGRSTRPSPATDAWLSVAAAWTVAIETGAPLAGCLHELARSQRSLGQAQRDIDAALAGPRSTSRLVMVLPLVGLLFGLLLGFDTIGTLVGTAPGLTCLTGATLLMLAAWRWSAAMVTRSTPRSTAPGLSIDLTAIAMSSGASVDRALAVVDSALAAFRPEGTSDAGAPDNAGESAAIGGVMALSRAAGVPAVDLLRGEADQARRDARSAAQLAAAALATRLMLPLGLCILPAFLLVGVAPLMLSVLSSTVRGIG